MRSRVNVNLDSEGKLLSIGMTKGVDVVVRWGNETINAYCSPRGQETHLVKFNRSEVEQ